MEEFISVYQHGILLGGSHSQVAWKADHEVKMGTQEVYGEVLLKSTLEWKKGSWIKLGWGAGLGCLTTVAQLIPRGSLELECFGIVIPTGARGPLCPPLYVLHPPPRHPPGPLR